jgi:hypothetical protein
VPIEPVPHLTGAVWGLTPPGESSGELLAG